MSGLLFQAFIYLIAAVIAVPIAKRLGLGSVLGYLIAGIVIGPVLGIVGTETVSIQHFAEFGVVMMLFLVGLELEPRALWAMRNRLLGLGGLQVGATIAAVTGIGMLFGLGWSMALAVGLVLSLSSTAIVLQTFNEKGLMKSDGGQAGFSVLLFQDIAVIPMLALLPLLALPELREVIQGGKSGSSHDAELSLVAGLAGWQVALVTIGAVAAVVIGGHYLARPLFRFIAGSQLREMFVAAALLLVIGIALLMTLVGLSPALGTFLAGVVLANSEYRHELESGIEPFKGLLLGLFFITVGAGINFTILFGDFGTIFGLGIGLIALKAFIFWCLALAFKLKGADKWLFTLGLAQAGEFGFVLLSVSVQNGVIPVELSQTLLLVVAISMLLTPLLFIFFDKFILPRMDQGQQRDTDEIDTKGAIIIAGAGRFGQVVNRMLRGNGYETVVLDLSAETIDNMRIFGVKAFFGDPSRPDLLHSAGLADAEMLVIAIDDQDRALKMVKHVRMDHPNLHIVVRAYGRNHVYNFYAAGANDIIRETFDSAVRAGRSALEGLGVHPYEAEKISRAFVKSDRDMLRQMAGVYNPDLPSSQNPEYVALAKEAMQQQEDAMRGSHGPRKGSHDRAWLPPGTKQEADE